MSARFWQKIMHFSTHDRLVEANLTQKRRFLFTKPKLDANIPPETAIFKEETS